MEERVEERVASTIEIVYIDSRDINDPFKTILAKPGKWSFDEHSLTVWTTKPGPLIKKILPIRAIVEINFLDVEPGR